ncbi:MAG: GNAT family N-acetyltransferase [Nevskia sp.]|nr:GNAT family N-acetyltransferase [Nevskia sp.]
MPAGFSIRTAVIADVPDILRLIKALAEYEKLQAEVVATEERLRESLFGARPAAETLLGCLDGRAVGFAVFFHNYSTFRGRAGIYLEDLFVEPAHRGSGYGAALLKAVARLAVERGCERLEWSVLDWNAPAIGFYRRLGALPQDDWTIYRLQGEALQNAAAP